MWAAFTAALQSVANLLGWGRERSALKNAADVKDAQKRQDEVNAQAKENKAIAREDIDAIRKNLAE